MTKIPSGTPDSAWQKAPVAPASSAAAQNVTQSAPNPPTLNTPRTDLTRYIPSASPLAMAVYTEAAVQRKENSGASEMAAPPADLQPQRSLAELPYLANPHNVKSERRASGASLAGAKAANTLERPSKSASPSQNGRFTRHVKWILIALVFLMLLVFW